MRRRRVVLLLSTMLATLVMASGVAMAVNKVCPKDTTSSNPCKGTKDNDTLIGTGQLSSGFGGNDYILALSGNDKISAQFGNDYTDGGAGNDTYSYTDGWGTDTVVDGSGVDTLNFAAVYSGIYAYLYPVGTSQSTNQVIGISGDQTFRVNVSLNPLSVIEKVVGSATGNDDIQTGGAANILQPGPGAGGANLTDWGGVSGFPVSSDTYSGFLASGYGPVYISDWGGTADKLILPFASTDAYFGADDLDGDGSADALAIMRTRTDLVYIYGQLEPFYNQPGHIETIQFTDGNFSIGSTSSTTSVSSSATSSSNSGISQVDALNASSTLSGSKKDELAKAAKKVLSEAKAPPTSPEDIKLPKK